MFEDPGAIEDATEDGELLPLRTSRGWDGSRIRTSGGRPGADQEPELYRALRPEALATLTYMAGLVRNISGAAPRCR